MNDKITKPTPFYVNKTRSHSIFFKKAVILQLHKNILKVQKYLNFKFLYLHFSCRI